MKNISYKIQLTVLMLMLAAVLAGGVVLLVNYAHNPYQGKKLVTETEVVGPEETLDPFALQSGRNYTDVPNGDGTRKRTIYLEPIEYRTGEDTFEAIDHTIVKTVGENNFVNTTNTSKTTFEQSGDDPTRITFNVPREETYIERPELPMTEDEFGNTVLDVAALEAMKESEDDTRVEFESVEKTRTIERSASFTIAGAANVSPVAEGNTITYPDMLEGMDVKYTVQTDGLIEEIIADEKPTANEFSQELSLSNVYYKFQDDGSITFHDTTTQNIVFYTPVPIMYELGEQVDIAEGDSDAVSFSTDIHYEVTETDEGTLIITKVIGEEGLAWLEQANYPVAIDNTYFGVAYGGSWSGHLYTRIRRGYPDDYSYTMPSAVSNRYQVGRRYRPSGSTSAYYSFFRRTYFKFNAHYYAFPPDYNEQDVVGAKLTFYADRMPSIGAGEYISVYYGKDVWPTGTFDAATIDEEAVWNSTGGCSNPVYSYDETTCYNQDGTWAPWVVTHAGDVTVGGLPDNRQACIDNPADCRLELIVPPDELNLSTGYTDFLFDSDGIVLRSTDYNEDTNHVNIWVPNISIPELRTTLEIIYLPVPVINVSWNHNLSDRLYVNINDDMDDEAGWVVERSLDGVSGWAQICDAVTNSSGACSSGGTFDCTGTTQAGDTGVCTVTDTGRTSDTPYYYRARVYRTDEISRYSRYSSIVGQWTPAQLIATILPFDSPAWNRLQVNGNGNLTDYFNSHANPNYTEYAMGIYGQFGSTPGYVQKFVAYPRYTEGGHGLYSLADPTATNPYYQASLTLDSIDWFWELGGISIDGYFLIEGSGAHQIWPGRDHWLCEFARDTRPGTPYLHQPPLFFPNDCNQTYSRNRLPSAPIVAESTATTMRLLMDITPYDSRNVPSDSTYINDQGVSYAMAVCDDFDGNGACDGGDTWEYLRPNDPAGRYGTEQWDHYPDYFPGYDWANGDPAQGWTYTGFQPATCYVLMATSRAFADGPIGDGYATMSNVEQHCTPLDPPDQPDVVCSYDDIGSDGYYCDVTIHDTANPSPPYYYKIERYYGWGLWTTMGNSSSTYGYDPGTGALTHNATWINHASGTTVRFKNLACSGSYDNLQFRISAAINAAGAAESAPSLTNGDSLPPCTPPAAPAVIDKTDTYINWNWRPSGTITSHDGLNEIDLYDAVMGQYYYNQSPLLANYVQSPLDPNSSHSLRVRGCDNGTPNNGNIERCGAWSGDSVALFTYAEIPTMTVDCDYNAPLDDYQCTLAIPSTANPQGSTSYQISYCVGWRCRLGVGFWIGLNPPGINFGWFGQSWDGSTSMVFNPYEDDDNSHVACNTLNTEQYYRIEVRNNDNEVTPQPAFPVYPHDTLPPCQPQGLSHSNQTTSSLRWTWLAPSGGETRGLHYVGNTSGCGTSTISFPASWTNLYRDQSGANTNDRCTVSVAGEDSRGGGEPDRAGKSASLSRYTSIEPVVDVRLYDVDTNQISVEALSSAGDQNFSQLAAGSSGIQFRERQNSTTSWTSPTWVKADAITHSGLSPNHNYCYQAQSRNGDGDVNGSWLPAEETQCRYTYAAIPEAPRLIRAEDGTSANITIRTSDGNPHGGSEPDTQYALCVTKYDGTGQVEWERYARTDGSIDFSGSNFNCLSGDGSGNWATFNQWGDNNGITIALDPSSKYDFTVKARNGDGPIIEGSGCVAGDTCIETVFGPKATLFLVRNNIVGWAWSSSLGWISTNCLNLYNLTGFGFSCSSAEDWGLNTHFEPTRDINPLGGYAWAASGRSIPNTTWSDVEQLNTNTPAQTNFHTSTDNNIAIDAFGNPHRVWAEAWSGNNDPKDIFYQKWDGQQWVTAGGIIGRENVTQTAAASIEPSLSLDSNGNPHIVWIESSRVWYVRWDPTADNGLGRWVTPTNTVYDPGITDPIVTQMNVSDVLGTGAGADNYPSLKVDDANQPHISFKHDVGGSIFDVYYTEWDGSNWVRPDGAVGFDDISITQSGDPQASLDVESATGYPHIVWTDGSDVFYRYWDGAVWSAEATINGPTTNTSSPDIVVDKNNIAHIAWGSLTGAHYIVWDAAAGDWAAVDGISPADTSLNYNAEIGNARFSIDLKLDANRNPHLIGYEWADTSSPQIIRYRWWDTTSKSAAGAWVTASGAQGNGLNDADLEVVNRTAESVRGVAMDINGKGDPFVIWGERLGPTDNDWSTFYRYWDSGFGESGAGWISLFTGVCANNTQKGCADNFDCGGAECIESAGSPPQTTDWNVQWNEIGVSVNGYTYEYAYDDATAGGPYVWVAVTENWADSPAGADQGLLQVRVSDLAVVNYVNLRDLVGGNETNDVTFDGTSLWVVSQDTDQVFKVNPVTLSVDATVNMASCASGSSSGSDPACNPDSITYESTTGDIWTSNLEGNNWWGSVSRFDPTLNKEVNCDDGSDPGAATPRRCGYCWNVNLSPDAIDPSITTEAACMAASINNHWGTGRHPVDIGYDETTDSLWIGHSYEQSITKWDINAATGTKIPLPSDYAYPTNGFARIGANLYFPHSSWTTHPLGEFGAGAISIVDPVNATILQTIEMNSPRLPQGIAYDGRYIWLSEWFNTGTCNDDAQLYCSAADSGTCQSGGGSCSFDYQCAGNDICLNDACASVGGGCSNSKTLVYQFEASNLQLVGSHQTAPADWHRANQLMFVNNELLVSSAAGYMTKIFLDSAEGIGYGYCYDQAGAAGQRYGVCSDNIGVCVADTDCVAGETCVYNTCSHDAECPDYVPTGANEQCKAIATASFSGVTREVTGWARIMSMKHDGERQGFNDWGWIRLGGQYDDGETVSGTYSLSGIEIDSQQFLGDPDVNPTDVQLYTLFGWGWNSTIIPSTRNNSIWLPNQNVTATGQVANDYSANYGESSLVVDSYGDPHMAWSEFNAANNSFDIYYARLRQGSWETATGTPYLPGTTDPVTSQLNVSNSVGADAFWPTLRLSTTDIPHIVWQQGGNEITDGEIFYSRWNPSGNVWTTANKVDDGGTPELELSRDSEPYVVYRRGDFGASEVFLRWFNGGNWTDVDPSDLDFNDDAQISSSGGAFYAWFPKLELSIEATQLPHVVWVEDEQVYYRHWDGVDWVTISGDAGGQDLSVSADVGADLSITLDAQDPDLALDSNNNPGIVWRDPEYVLYRTWSGSDWVSISGDPDEEDIWINEPTGAEVTQLAGVGQAPSLIFDSNDQPHVVWSDDAGVPAFGDVRYRYWSDEANGNNGAWITASGGFGSSGGPGNYDDQHLTVATTNGASSQSASIVLDAFDNPHISWNEVVLSAQTCNIANGNADCTDAQFPQCLQDYNNMANYYCGAVDVHYSKWFPGNVPTGIGWIEFIPAGALIGIPYVQTAYGDVYSATGVQLAPPPRGSDQYTATYLILANGDIQGIPGNYLASQSGDPTTSLIEPGLEPLVTDAGFPLGRDVLSRLDIDSLINIDTGTQNKYGHEVISVSAGDISSSVELGTAPVLDGAVYYINGDASIDNEMTYIRGDQLAPTTGNGLIVIDGDLEINSNVYYDSNVASGSYNAAALADITEMPSAAVIVRGNVYINSLVDEFAGVLVALDPDTTDSVSEGIVSTSRKVPETFSVQLAADDTSVTSVFTNNVFVDTLRFGRQADGTILRSFMRWPISIPAGAEIRNAYINFHQSDTVSAGNSFEARIQLIDSDDASDFSGLGEPIYTIDTTNSVTYDLAAWDPAAGSLNVSPDIKSLVQRFIDQPGYTPGNHIGLVINEGTALNDDYKSITAFDHPSGTPAELVIEYSPRRTVYTVGADADDIVAWGTAEGSSGVCLTAQGAECDVDAACINVGWYSSQAYRGFLRLSPGGAGYTEIPNNAEIIESHLRAVGNGCNGDAASFQLRQGLLDEVNIPAFSANPYDYALSQEVSEVAEDVAATAWGAGIVYELADSSSLVQAWVDASGYTRGGSIGLRLRRGGNETFAGANESRPITNTSSELHIDYQVPLHVSGLMIAQGYSFDRKYTKNLEAAEQIVYDGRVVANTPPGLADFTKALPVYNRVTP